MTTVAVPERVVTGGVDTHLDLDVAAALDHLGGVLGTASFPTTVAGYRRLLAWLRSFGDLGQVGVEGTGSYGAALARHLTAEGVDVVEVSRPNRQVRRRHGKTDVVDAIAAARALMSGRATATLTAHDGAVESLRMLKLLQRSANKTRTQALNQLRSRLVTAPPELRSRLQSLPRPELRAVCAAFRIGADDDTIAGITRLTLRRSRAASAGPRRAPRPRRQAPQPRQEQDRSHPLPQALHRPREVYAALPQPPAVRQ